MRIRKRISQAGFSMAWWAAFLGFVLAPLMSLAVDVTRLLFLRVDLQTSVDAACEAAALAADTTYFNNTGNHRIHSGRAVNNASEAFVASAAESGAVQYNPSLTSVTLISPTEVACTAHASLKPFIPFSPELNVEVRAQAKMRFIKD
jgi:hypothetical protein